MKILLLLLFPISILAQTIIGDGQYIILISDVDTVYLNEYIDTNTLITNHNNVKINPLFETYSSTEMLDTLFYYGNNYPTLPNVGDKIYKDTYYRYDTILVLCIKTGNLYGNPCDYPKSFVCPRHNGWTLEWILNEDLIVGDIRVYNSIQYQCIKNHKTKESNKPPDDKYWQVY